VFAFISDHQSNPLLLSHRLIAGFFLSQWCPGSASSLPRLTYRAPMRPTRMAAKYSLDPRNSYRKGLVKFLSVEKGVEAGGRPKQQPEACVL
jgi:hypothetical protein